MFLHNVQSQNIVSHAQKRAPLVVGCHITAVTALSRTNRYKRLPSATLHMMSCLSSPPLARNTPHGEKARELMLSVWPPVSSCTKWNMAREVALRPSWVLSAERWTQRWPATQRQSPRIHTSKQDVREYGRTSSAGTLFSRHLCLTCLPTLLVDACTYSCTTLAAIRITSP